MLIEFIEAKGFADKPFETFAAYLDDQIATFVLGQTLTTRDGGSLGQAKVHNEIRLDLAEDDAYELGVTIDEDLLGWFVSLNFGAEAPCPRIEFPVPKPADVAVISTALGVLVPLGLEVDQDDVRRLTTLPKPAAGAKLLKPPANAAPTDPPRDPNTGQAVRQAQLNRAIGRFTPGCRCETCRAALNRVAEGFPPGEPDLVEQIGIDESRDWESQTGPMLDAIMAAAGRATSFETFQAELTKLYGALPTGGLAKRLAIATTEARGLGEVQDDV